MDAASFVARRFFRRHRDANGRLEVAQKIPVGEPHALEPQFVPPLVRRLLRRHRRRDRLAALQQEFRRRARRRQRARQVLPRLAPPDPEDDERGRRAVQRGQRHGDPFARELGRGVGLGVAAGSQLCRVEGDGPDARCGARVDGGRAVGGRVFVASHDVIGAREDDLMDCDVCGMAVESIAWPSGVE